jgi:hypothetical protein
MIATVPYPIAVSKLRRPFLSDRYFVIVVRLLRRREKFTEPDFALSARAFNRARALHPFYLTAWVFLPDPAAAGHCICGGWRIRSLESAISRRDQGGGWGTSSRPSAKRAFGRSQTLGRTCERMKKSCHSERSEESRSDSQIVPMVRAERDSSLRSE